MEKEEIVKKLENLEGWSVIKTQIQKEFKFQDFKEAFEFMISVADIAEELNHHPEWYNVYNRVIVRLTTHDEGGLTALDFDMASRINRI